jgi:hypothetical protein
MQHTSVGLDLIVLLSGALGSGCSTIQFPTYTPPPQALHRGITRRVADLELSIDAFTEAVHYLILMFVLMEGL